MIRNRRSFIVGSAGLAAGAFAGPVLGQPKKKMHFGVGPLLPNPEDTKKAYTPLFAHLAKELGVDYDLVATTDWAGMAVAMGSGQLDIAWMGPWGYIIADLQVAKGPDDTKGKSMSFADVGSTSGWLVPTYYAKDVWKIDPKTFWKYSEGATHAANEIAVSSGQVDMATDFDRNRNAMIAAGQVKPDANKIIWTSAPRPNAAIVLPSTAAKELGAQVQKILTAITVEQAKTLLPPRYTGFVPATHATYDTIEKAGIAVGKIKARS